MKEHVVISRYAEAFIAHAKELKSLEVTLEDCRGMKTVLRENPEFMRFLQDPVFTHAEKLSFIDRVLGAAVSTESVNFVKLLFEKGRVSLLEDIIEYVRIKYAHEGEYEVLMRTASLHDLELIKAVQDKLRQKLGSRLKFYLELDGRLLGGIQVVVGNMVMDGSVRRRLDELRLRFEKVRV